MKRFFSGKTLKFIFENKKKSFSQYHLDNKLFTAYEFYIVYIEVNDLLYEYMNTILISSDTQLIQS